MTISILAAGLSYLIPNQDGHNPAYVAIIGLFTYIFVALYSVGLGPVPFTYSAECFPLEVRMVGMSFAVSVNLLGAGILALFVPVLTTELGHPALLGIFAGLNVLALILVFLFVPETAGAVIANDPANADGRLTAMSLEELNYVYGIKTEVHVEYQCKEVFRDYFWKRYIVRDKTWSRPQKFYMWQSERARSRANTASVSTTQGGSQAAQSPEMPPTQRQQSVPTAQSNARHRKDQGGQLVAGQNGLRRQEDAPSRDSHANNGTVRNSDNIEMVPGKSECSMTPTTPMRMTDCHFAVSSNRSRVTWSEETAREIGSSESELDLPSGPRFWQMMRYLSDRVASLERAENNIPPRAVNGNDN